MIATFTDTKLKANITLGLVSEYLQLLFLNKVSPALRNPLLSI